MRAEVVDRLSDILARAGRCVAAAACEAWGIVSEELKTTPGASVRTADGDEGLTVAQAAAELNVEPWRVYEMVRRGLLQHYRPSPRTIRIRRAVVKEFVREGKCTRVERPEGRAEVVPLRRAG
jgi:excisionase family DNA binding protein